MIVTASRNHSLSLFTIQNAYSNFIWTQFFQLVDKRSRFG